MNNTEKTLNKLTHWCQMDDEESTAFQAGKGWRHVGIEQELQFVQRRLTLACAALIAVQDYFLSVVKEEKEAEALADKLNSQQAPGNE